MNQPSPAMLDEEEDVERLEEESVHREEVAGPDLGSVILQKGAPGLGRWRPPCLVQVAAHGLAANLEAESEQFTADALGAPERISHAPS